MSQSYTMPPRASAHIIHADALSNEAIMVEGGVYQTATVMGKLANGNYSQLKIATDDAVKAVLTVGVDAAALTLTAKTAGADGNNTGLIVEVPAEPNTELAVHVSSGVITVTLATDENGVAVSTAKEVAEKINATTSSKALVVASYGGDGSAVLSAIAKTNLSGGESSTTIGTTFGCVLIGNIDAESGARSASGTFRLAKLQTDKLIWPAGISAEQQQSVIDEMNKKFILLR